MSVGLDHVSLASSDCGKDFFFGGGGGDGGGYIDTRGTCNTLPMLRVWTTAEGGGH